MRAAVACAGSIVEAELDDLKPTEGKVLVRTQHGDICGSGLHALQRGDFATAPDTERSSALGTGKNC